MSNAFGSVAAAGLAAFAMHELTGADAGWVKTTAEVLGSGLGGAGGAYLNDHWLHMPTLSIKHFRLKRLLRAKTLSDFKYSFLGKTSDILTAIRESESILKAADLTGVSQGVSGLEIPQIISSHALSVLERTTFERTLCRKEPLRVNCGALFPAALAVLLNLKERLKGTVELDIDYSDTNSHDQFERVAGGDYFDFVIAAEGPFFLAVRGNEAGTISSEGLKRYHRVFPCNIEWQHAFIRKGRERLRRAHVFQASSAELQFRAGLAALNPGIEQVKLFRGSQVAFLSEKSALDPGEGVIAWEPLANLFQNSPHFEPVPNSRFRVWISLFSSDKWLARGRQKQRDAFRALFIDEWRALNNPLGHKLAFSLLEETDAILDNFAICAGLSRDERFAPDAGRYS